MIESEIEASEVRGEGPLFKNVVNDSFSILYNAGKLEIERVVIFNLLTTIY